MARDRWKPRITTTTTNLVKVVRGSWWPRLGRLDGIEVRVQLREGRRNG